MHRVYTQFYAYSPCFVTLYEPYYHTKNIMWLAYVSEKEVWKLDAAADQNSPLAISGLPQNMQLTVSWTNIFLSMEISPSPEQI